ncbi:hypothetical protein DTO027I6_4047 [Penicillium roqueforti]|uniref:uncharacterized protein n=1 Tax=Penicillium roqueforti TaxID=5082 RepID=UPI0019095B41|nr:uncharacterized protein LCP9604111_3320 [Penicillium roqueforti]KAF9250418.1 hypothetical protein LCP9604111_3320 [Penicillium roqueforti]KAI1833105.1 hypothetical protein CBS147337_6062 [Penicillium roqueforti]KAI2671581.1 hypothetical protein CBS147355_8573 [Penicillium roqueforti]KAI3211628.1 hypothetical protein DTO027I6_4047 [Penicillium roqueforti]
MDSNLALVYGPTEPQLCLKTMGALIEDQAAQFGDRPAVVFPWQSVRLSYRQLADRSKALAGEMLEMGLHHGDCVGILAGNCYQYVEVFLAGARIGCPVVVLNNTYTPAELENAVLRSSCKVVFHATSIGSRDLTGHIRILQGTQYPNPALPDLRRIISLGLGEFRTGAIEVQLYDTVTSNSPSVSINNATLEHAERQVTPQDVVNLQFTSGTTGSPKAAMLTHTNLINNAQFVGRAMQLTPEDVICCPPPMFHCFGLVLGFLSSFFYGSSIVFPSDYFDVAKVVDAIIDEDATVLLGVPTMYVAELEVMAKTGQRPRRLRTGLASGSAVSQNLMNQLREIMGVEKMLIAYGMTETSPVSFITSLDDSDEKGTTTVGRVIPHTAAKVIDEKGNTLARGQRGELCTSGFVLQKGYWKNEEKTKEVMRRDENGVLWMHTGDEAMIDSDGYAHITGRIKDLIIRGGENIFPREIEERLMSHASVSEASVVGIKDERYGEVVGCFLKASVQFQRPSIQELQQFVGERLGRHKAPKHVFWLGEKGVGDDFPKTGSGKHQKHMMRDIGNRLVGMFKAKL